MTLIRSTLFWDMTQHRIVITYRRFEITYRAHTQGNIPEGPRSGRHVIYWHLSNLSLDVYSVLRNETLKFVTNLGERRNVFLQSKRVIVPNSEGNMNAFFRTIDASSEIITQVALSPGELSLRVNVLLFYSNNMQYGEEL